MAMRAVPVEAVSSPPSVGRRHMCAWPREIIPFPPFPPELQLKILQYLPQNDLRAASKASRAFYLLALAAGLFICRKVEWQPSHAVSPGFGRSLRSLNRVVDYVTNHRPGLNIAVRASFANTKDEAAAAACAAVERFFTSVERALPHLVRLDLTLPQCVPNTVFARLCAAPAPRLHHFAIEHRTYGSAVGIPQDLFKRDAPHLSTLSLSVVTTDSVSAWASVSALQRITRLELSANEAPRPIALARLFPALRSLVLRQSLGHVANAGRIDLSGLCLEYLALACGTEILTDASALAVIPVVEQAEHMTQSGWPVALGGDVCARAEAVCEDHSSVSFIRADGTAQWRRTVRLDDRGAPLPLADIPALASVLVSITLDKCLINAFVQTPVTLVALRELVLDVSTRFDSCWPPVAAHHLGLRVHFDELSPECVRVRCPVLARVVIFALPTGHPVTVRPTKVTRLGRALSLGAPAPMPMLTLAGCWFHDPPIWLAIDRFFTSVEYMHCAGNVIPGYYRTCRYSGTFDGLKWYEQTC